MNEIRVDRRGFVLGSAVAAGAMLCVRPLWALPRLEPLAASASVLACPGSEEWTELSAAAMVAQLQDAKEFAGSLPTGRAIKGAVRMAIIGGGIDLRRAGPSARVRVEFPAAGKTAPRLVEGMGLTAGESPTGIAMTVPASDGAVWMRLTIMGADGKEVEQRLSIPAHRGLYAMMIDPGAARRVRWADGRLESDAACCVVLSLDDIDQAGSKDK